MIGRQEENHLDVVPLCGGYRPKRLKSKRLYILLSSEKNTATIMDFWQKLDFQSGETALYKIL